MDIVPNKALSLSLYLSLSLSKNTPLSACLVCIRPKVFTTDYYYRLLLQNITADYYYSTISMPSMCLESVGALVLSGVVKTVSNSSKDGSKKR